MSAGYVETVTRLIKQLSNIAGERRLPYLRWIITPDGDLGSEWCRDCGYYKVRNLRRHDRKRREDYILDGGWRTEEEGFKYCAGCGSRLDVCLTDYGLREELAHYEECGFSGQRGEDAYELSEMLSAVEYRSDRESDDEAEIRRALIRLAETFLAEPRP